MNRKLLFATILLANLSTAQTLTNGGLSTGATANVGTSAPAGYTWSEAQNITGNTTESNGTAGVGGTFNSATSNFFLADDFVIPAGSQWQISSIEFFAYQTGYTGTTNPFTTVRVNIYSSDPSVAGAVSVFGDDTTNRYASGVDSNMYRIFNSAVPTTANVPGTTRRIWRVKANTVVTLNPGTYWVKYQLQNATPASGGFLPPVTIPGSRGLATYNAKQYNAVTPGWTSLVDDGVPATAVDFPIDMPFVITYTVASLGTQEIMQYDNRIQVYPNPVKDVFKINNPGKIQISSVEIMDASGRTIKVLKGAEEYNVSELPKGNYMLKILNNESSKITKLIKL